MVGAGIERSPSANRLEALKGEHEGHSALGSMSSTALEHEMMNQSQAVNGQT
jgi:hypothetical protein